MNIIQENDEYTNQSIIQFKNKLKSRFLIFLVIIFCFFPTLIEIFAQVENPNIRVDDPSFMRENLQTGEAMNDQSVLTVTLIDTLGPILIVLFIVIYAIKKRANGDDK